MEFESMYKLKTQNQVQQNHTLGANIDRGLLISANSTRINYHLMKQLQ
jgi:hypothetical protein